MSKQIVNIIFIGHVDSGKSTTLGRLMYEFGGISQQRIRKLEEEAERLGKPTFGFAYVFDKLQAERERGITIDLGYNKLHTERGQFTVIDAPGHKDFVKNMTTGTSQADAAFLLLSATGGVQPQTEEHAFLAHTLGIRTINCLVNKLDEYPESEQQARFERVVNDLTETLRPFRIRVNAYVPISAQQGINIRSTSPTFSWWNGVEVNGVRLVTVEDLIDNIQYVAPSENLPLRMPIQDVFSVKGVGIVASGVVNSSVLRPGPYIVQPANVRIDVKTIEMHHESYPEAFPGMNVGITVKGVTKEQIPRGSVICSTANPGQPVTEFRANVMIVNHPTSFVIGYSPVLHIHTEQVSVEFIEFIGRLDPRGQIKEANPLSLKNGDMAVVRFRARRPIFIERMRENPRLARFALRDMGITIGAGVCVDF